MYTRVPVEVLVADCGYGASHMENQYNCRALVFIRAELRVLAPQRHFYYGVPFFTCYNVPRQVKLNLKKIPFLVFSRISAPILMSLILRPGL